MARIVDQVGPLRIARRRERFAALARAMIFQQLAGAAASAILKRFIEQIGNGKFPTPEIVLKASAAKMRRAGISKQKNLYLKDLARHIVDGELNFHKFARMSDEEIIEHLTRVKGIGRWTAEMFLMFNLGRPDVCPADDLGLRNAITKAYGLNAHLKPKDLREFGERWRPYRSAATWYLWRSLNIKLPDGG
jgi:DNA-3-methyladenine glycosylase II